ncbi:MAG TPA: response regulator [Thermoanaerobaculia bacterium]|nr:response regulator [Thermoanaerobaculia bacterium]
MDKPFVLLADDNEATCTLIRALLQPYYEVHIVTDGNEAIERLKSRQYAAILVDLLMPGADGYVVLDFLRAELPGMLSKAVIITAAISHREMARIESYPIGGLIRKPFDIDALLATVRAIACDSTAPPPLRGSLLSSGMLLLLADFLTRR